MATRNMQRYSTSLIIREMQIETTIRYHFTYVRMAIIKKTTDNKCWQECGEKGFPGSAVVKNLPANAEDMGSSPGPGRSHMPRSN